MRTFVVDYASVSLDPVDGCTLWATHEFQGATSWATRVATLRFASCCSKAKTFVLSLSDDQGRTQQCSNVSSLLSTPPSFNVAGDPDLDSVLSATDNCPLHWNPQQSDVNSDGVGDVCDYESVAPPIACPVSPVVDTDGDGVCDAVDNCVSVRNPFQENSDVDAAGGNECDLCPDMCSGGSDMNSDGIGDECSPSSLAPGTREPLLFALVLLFFSDSAQQLWPPTTRASSWRIYALCAPV